LSKIFNDEWLADYGFLQADDEQTVGAVMAAKSGGNLPDFVHTHPSETVREAIDILRTYGVSQMPVLRAEPPVRTAEIVGSVHDRDLLDALFTGRAQLADRLVDHMAPPLPQVGAGETVHAAMIALEKADAAVVVDDGRPTGVLTRQDVLAFLST
jgi:cystathionine beta-synthase